MSAVVLRGIVRLINDAGGRVETRIRLQKLAYLCRQMRSADFTDVEFSFHHYGPYSREISDTIQHSVNHGLVNEVSDEFAGGVRYLYSLSEQGKEWIKRYGGTSSPEERKVSGLAAEPWRALELAATVIYLEKEESIDRKTAFSRSLAIKGKCAPFREQADSILTSLGL